MAVRTGVLPPDEGHRRLHFAGCLRALWQAALARAIATDVAVYDTLFVELAYRLRLPLVTFDAKILKAFPDELVGQRLLFQGLEKIRQPLVTPY